LAALLAAIAAALVRRHFLRRDFGVRIPPGHGAGPLAAACGGIAVAAALMALPAADPLRLGAALAGGLAAYALLLIFVLRLTGESLSMTHFVVGE
jgi:hypothetical protein